MTTDTMVGRSIKEVDDFLTSKGYHAVFFEEHEKVLSLKELLGEFGGREFIRFKFKDNKVTEVIDL